MSSIYAADPDVVVVNGTYYNAKVEPVEAVAVRATASRRRFCRADVLTQEAALAQPKILTTERNFGVGATGPLRDMVACMHKHQAGVVSLQRRRLGKGGAEYWCASEKVNGQWSKVGNRQCKHTVRLQKMKGQPESSTDVVVVMCTPHTTARCREHSLRSRSVVMKHLGKEASSIVLSSAIGSSTTVPSVRQFFSFSPPQPPP